MRSFEVGQQVVKPSPDGVVFDIDDSGAILLVKLSRPTAKEKQNFKGGVPQFRVAVVDDIIFFLSRFGVGSWQDSPYNVHLSLYDTPLPTITDPDMGLSLHAMLIDASTGVLVTQKLIGLPHDLSIGLIELAKNQPQIPDYTARLNYVMAQYSTLDLLSMAVL